MGTSRPLSDEELDEIPVAMARQPLWSIGVWAAELDDDEEVVAHLDGHDDALGRGVEILNHLDDWRRELRG